MGKSNKKDKCKCKNKYIAKQIGKINLEYRDISGQNNNLEHPEWGKANRQLLRKAPSAYEDGLNVPAGSNRPSPREISNVIFNQDESIPQKGSSYLWAWGQFVDHDLDLTPSDKTESLPIAVPKGDPIFDPSGKGDVTLPFHRSIFDQTTGITTPRQQVNTISAFLDGTNVYASDTKRLKYMRSGINGKLLYSQGYMLPYNNGSMNNAPNSDQSMYVAGDVRCNENLPLTSLHTLWMREHNYWAGFIHKCHPCLSDEEIFQRAKVIVEAELQIITYNEFLKLLLGKEGLTKYKKYNSEIDGQIVNEFSTAGYRLGHSMVDSVILRLNKNNQTDWCGNVTLRESFFCPWILTNGGGIDNILRGLANSNAQKIDSKVISDLRNFLFGNTGEGGMDLVSLNIQRGRDHGLSDYNTTREACGLDKVNSFNDITKNTELSNKLQTLYQDINNIDLWVGCLCEDPIKGSQLGPVCHAIVKDQFERTRDGDRFWYENRFKEYPKLLNLFNETKLSDVILRNSGVGNISENVFVFDNNTSENNCSKGSKKLKTNSSEDYYCH